jgi:23S rRNA (pseudouridine1915-N3)-methyltransferase
MWSGKERRVKLHVIARGKIGRSAEAELVARYAKRIAWPLTLTELPESGGSVPAALAPAREVLLDERGRQLSSEDFAALLGSWRDAGVREARFLIGAADGHGEAARERADLLLGFGAMTWPHLLVRAMLLEQLWRATSILAGHPYHRSG